LRERDWSGDLDSLDRERPNLSGTILAEANLSGANLAGASLSGAILVRANLSGANLIAVSLSDASLSEANLSGARLDGTNLSGARLDGTNLSGACLDGVRMDVDTKLQGIRLDSATRLADVIWNNVPLTQVDWGQVRRLGDETVAWQPRDSGKPKDAATRRQEFAAAVRANRQLATVLRDQGLNDDADRFGYRAQVLQRQVLRRQGRLLSAIGSRFLDLVAGYGYKPMRSFLTYLLVVLGFAGAYFALGGSNGHPLAWNEAIVVSMTAFHGRGFFAAVFQPGDLQAAVAAGEAFIGLLIEIVFIATFTNRFFAR
jgi:hypothetical protein